MGWWKNIQLAQTQHDEIQMAFWKEHKKTWGFGHPKTGWTGGRGEGLKSEICQDW